MSSEEVVDKASCNVTNTVTKGARILEMLRNSGSERNICMVNGVHSEEFQVNRSGVAKRKLKAAQQNLCESVTDSYDCTTFKFSAPYIPQIHNPKGSLPSDMDDVLLFLNKQNVQLREMCLPAESLDAFEVHSKIENLATLLDIEEREELKSASCWCKF